MRLSLRAHGEDMDREDQHLARDIRLSRDLLVKVTLTQIRLRTMKRIRGIVYHHQSTVIDPKMEINLGHLPHLSTMNIPRDPCLMSVSHAVGLGAAVPLIMITSLHQIPNADLADITHMVLHRRCRLAISTSRIPPHLIESGNTKDHDNLGILNTAAYHLETITTISLSNMALFHQRIMIIVVHLSQNIATTTRILPSTEIKPSAKTAAIPSSRA